MFIPANANVSLNPIEWNWCRAKKVARQYVNGSIVRLREVVPTSLDAGSIEMMNKFCRTCYDYEMAYRSGCNGKDVELRVNSINLTVELTLTG